MYFRVTVALSGVEFGGVNAATDADLIGSAANTALNANPVTGTSVYWSQAGIGAIINGFTLQTINGTKIEEIPSYANVLIGMQNYLTTKDYSTTLQNTENVYSQFANLSTAGGAVGAVVAIANPGIPVGAQVTTLASKTYCLNLPLGLLNQISAIPVELIGGLEFQITLAAANNVFIYTSSTANAGIRSITYTVTNFELVADRLTLSDEYVNAMTQHIRMNGLKLPYVTFRSNITTVIPANTINTVNIADSANSVQCIYFGFSNSAVIGTTSADSCVNFTYANLQSYQYRIAGVYVPNYGVNTLPADNGMAFIETLKCRGTYKSYLTGSLLDYTKTNLNIYGYSLERVEDAMSGVSTAGKQMDIALNFSGPVAINGVNQTMTMFVYMRIDAVLMISPDGSVTVMT
jgi:hypothetical protein